MPAHESSCRWWRSSHDFTRGILIDVPRLKGIPYLEPGTQITLQDIEAWEKVAGVKVAAGDALFIRTGRWRGVRQSIPGTSAARGCGPGRMPPLSRS